MSVVFGVEVACKTILEIGEIFGDASVLVLFDKKVEVIGHESVCIDIDNIWSIDKEVVIVSLTFFI